MKAVVLAGGQGTRLRPLTYSVPKQLIPVGGRPVLSHVLLDVASCGIEETIVITSPESHGPVSDLLSMNDHGLKATLVVQQSPNGLAAAYALALPYIGDDSSLLYLGDCLVTGGISHMVEEHIASRADATILATEVDDPRRYGIVEQDGEGIVTSLVEKPENPRSNLAIVGVYAFEPAIAEAVRAIGPSARGEYEITDAIQHLVSHGGLVRSVPLEGWWIDTGTVTDIVAAHRRIMASIADKREGNVVDSDVKGPVIIGPGASVIGSTVQGPAIIGPEAVVTNSHVGASSHLGRSTELTGARVDESIVMDGAKIRSVRLIRSIVGPRATVSGTGDLDQLEVILGADAIVASGFSQEG